MSSDRVLFVSKPIVPPWHDGSKNLVRDLATSLERFGATVLVTEGAAAPAGVRGLAAYKRDARGGFAPALVDNARVAAALLTVRDHRVWHFVFAPNPLSSGVATVLTTARRRLGLGRVVQTVASQPRSFDRLRGLLFGDVVACQSDWTRSRFVAAGAPADRLVVVPPCARARPAPSLAERRALRERLDLGDRPIVLYAGDLEVSHGAATVAAAVPTLTADAVTVFACRRKTAQGAAAEEALRVGLADKGCAPRVRFAGELSDLAPLLFEAAVLAMPVDDLYGKVDVPLVVVEALAAGVPLVLANGGPLEEVTSAAFVPPRDSAAVAAAIGELLRSDERRREQAAAGRALFDVKFRPDVVAARYEALYL